MEAAFNGHTAAIELLMQHGASAHSPDSAGNTALSIACRAGHAGAAKLLLGADADVMHLNTEQKSPLLLACECVSGLRFHPTHTCGLLATTT